MVGVRLGAEPASVMVTTLAGRFRGVSRAGRGGKGSSVRGCTASSKVGKKPRKGLYYERRTGRGRKLEVVLYPPTQARDRWSFPGCQYMSRTRVTLRA